MTTASDDMKLIHQAALEMRNAMAALTEKVECGEITQADLQREMEQATVGLDELTRAIGTAAGFEYEGPWSPVLPNGDLLSEELAP
jgi:hypothetical protein